MMDFVKCDLASYKIESPPPAYNLRDLWHIFILSSDLVGGGEHSLSSWQVNFVTVLIAVIVRL